MIRRVLSCLCSGEEKEELSWVGMRLKTLCVSLAAAIERLHPHSAASRKLKYTAGPSMGCIHSHPIDITVTRNQLAGITSLDNLLKDPDLLEKFKQFAMREHSADLLFFWMEVEEYPQIIIPNTYRK